MLNRQLHPKRKQPLDWLRIGVGIIFVLVLLAGSLVFILFSTSKTASVPTVEMSMTPVILNTATLTFTSFPESSPTISPSPTPQVYVVKEGDTLYSIAIGFGIPVEALKFSNALSS